MLIKLCLLAELKACKGIKPSDIKHIVPRSAEMIAIVAEMIALIAQ